MSLGFGTPSVRSLAQASSSATKASYVVAPPAPPICSSFGSLDMISFVIEDIHIARRLRGGGRALVAPARSEGAGDHEVDTSSESAKMAI